MPLMFHETPRDCWDVQAGRQKFCTGHTINRERVEEPTDAEVKAALDAFKTDDGQSTSSGPMQFSQMIRNALRAAFRERAK